MIRLICSGSIARAFSAEQLADFLEITRLRNQHEGICGVMVLMELDFLQIIEGPDDEVDRLFEEQRKNSPRNSIMLLSRQPIEQAIFAAWSLGFIKTPAFGETPSEEDNQMLLDIEQIDPQDPSARHSLRILREFVAGKWHLHVSGGNSAIVVRRGTGWS